MVADEDNKDLLKEGSDGSATLDLHQPIEDVAEEIRCHHAHLVDEEHVRLLHDVPHDVVMPQRSDEALCWENKAVVDGRG